MSALLLSRLDTTKLYPPFLAQLQAMLEEAQQQGHAYWAISGFRTYAEQSKLYAQGRTPESIARKEKIVTQANGGQSAHNFGIAVDLCRDGLVDRAGLQPDYNPPSYDLLGVLAPKHGLVWGGSWKFKDLPHVQVPGYVTADQLKPLRTVYEASGLASVFQAIDRGLTCHA